MDEGYTTVGVLATLGQEILSTKYLSIACATILFYEYFLTFADEVKYAWKGRKTWVSLLFCMNRYLPIAYKIWDLSYDGQYQFTQLVIWKSENVISYCTATTFAEGVYLVIITLLSQLFLAMRVYAIKGRSKASFALLSCMTVFHLSYGAVYIAFFRRQVYSLVSLTDPGEYTFALCLQGTDGIPLQLGYLGLSLIFDVVAFVMIAAFSYSSTQAFRSSSLFSRVVQDATVYFLLIVWVHLTVLIYVSSMGDSRILMLFPAITNTVIPVMICRLVLSLRKATDPNLIRAWNVDHFSTQIVSQSNCMDGLHMSPLRFQSLSTSVATSSVVTSSARGTESENGTTLNGNDGSPNDSAWTINVLGDDESSRAERGYRIP